MGIDLLAVELDLHVTQRRIIVQAIRYVSLVSAP